MHRWPWIRIPDIDLLSIFFFPSLHMNDLLILTQSDDFHAISISHYLETEFGIHSVLLNTDMLSEKSVVTVNPITGLSDISTDKVLLDADPENTVVWNRRRKFRQQSVAHLSDRDLDHFIAESWRPCLSWVLRNVPESNWISHTDSSSKAESKIYQLHMACRCGLRVPETIFSNSVEDIKAFSAQVDGSLVAKPVYHHRAAFFETKKVPEDLEGYEASIAVCPHIFQEFVPGFEHLRVNVFGDMVIAFSIVTENLDWRTLLPDQINQVDISLDLKNKLKHLLENMGLKMGIFDLKIDERSGEAVFLEINPQGQFLFLEGITGIPLKKYFSEYLMEYCATVQGN